MKSFHRQAFFVGRFDFEELAMMDGLHAEDRDDDPSTNQEFTEPEFDSGEDVASSATADPIGAGGAVEAETIAGKSPLVGDGGAAAFAAVESTVSVPAAEQLVELLSLPTPSPAPGVDRLELPFTGDGDAGRSQAADLPSKQQVPLAAHNRPADPAAASPLGQTMPRLQVMVTLVDAKTALTEILETASEQMSPRMRQVAEGTVNHAFWVRKCEERAADWRLRGP